MKRYSSAGKFNLILASVFLILFTNCAKEEDEHELDYSKVYLIKNLNEKYNGHGVAVPSVNYRYEYDTTGRIVYMKLSPEGYADEEYTYQYTSPSMIYIIHFTNYSSPDTTFLELNENGLVITEHEPRARWIKRIKYNDQGYRVYDKSGKYSGDTSNITWTQQNTYSIVDGNYVRPYYKDKVNTIGHINFGKPFYGKSSKNLEKSSSTDTFDKFERLSISHNNYSTITYSYYE